MQTTQYMCDELVIKVMRETMGSGLSPMEAITMLGYAARAVAAQHANKVGSGDAIAIARQCLTDSYDLPHRYTVIGSDKDRTQELMDSRVLILPTVNKIN